uniref:Uncharacterized protein n=1 Tax=Arundo donax TaxID=35708 RepID=A0A0A9HGM3_ARUDO
MRALRTELQARQHEELPRRCVGWRHRVDLPSALTRSTWRRELKRLLRQAARNREVTYGRNIIYNINLSGDMMGYDIKDEETIIFSGQGSEFETYQEQHSIVDGIQVDLYD